MLERGLLTRLLGDELLVDADLAELVLDDRETQTMGVVGQDVVQQRGLAGTEEARQDGDGDEGVLGVGHLVEWVVRLVTLESRDLQRAVGDSRKSPACGWGAKNNDDAGSK